MFLPVEEERVIDRSAFSFDLPARNQQMKGNKLCVSSKHSDMDLLEVFGQEIDPLVVADDEGF